MHAIPILLLFLVCKVSALPKPSLDSCDLQGSPDSYSSTRTTSGIVWSCITTIFACTWVAIHPDIPDVSDSDRKIFWRRVRILVAALIAPEFVIIWAASQLRSARKAIKVLRQIHSCRDWTLTHGMFLVMGGFMLTDGDGKQIRTVQNEEDLAELLKQSLVILRDIPESEIVDRSKGDALAKALVLIQTSWFIVQVVSRAVLHLPITELELTTVAFALLNFLTYAFWWKKPLDVRYPISISLHIGAGLPSSLSETTLSSSPTLILNTSGSQDSKVSSDSSSEANSIHYGNTYPPCTSDNPSHHDCNQLGPDHNRGIANDENNLDLTLASNVAEDPLSSSSTVIDLEDIGNAKATDIAAVTYGHIKAFPETAIPYYPSDTAVSKSFDNLQCAKPPEISSPTHDMPNEVSNGTSHSKACSEVASSSIEVEKGTADVKVGDSGTCGKELGELASKTGNTSYRILTSGQSQARRLFDEAQHLWRWFIVMLKRFYRPGSACNPPDVGQNIASLMPVASELCIGALFGLIHCAAWTFQFPSTVEQHLWRIMSLCITGAPLVLLSGKLLLHMLLPSRNLLTAKDLPSRLRVWIGDKYMRFTRYIYVVFAIYILARLTTFILAFELLRDIPSGALEEVQWTTFIPHV